MQKYCKPEMEVIELLTVQDVICTSGGEIKKEDEGYDWIS